MSITIGLTGPTGAGKSSATVRAAEMGFVTVDCDALAREAVEKETAGYKALVKVFGREILNKDGTLNRKALAKKAFSSAESTELLNQTLLPHIALLVKKRAIGEKILLDAPTLFESGIDSMCDFTVAVLADEAVRLNRITARDGIDDEAARLRISAGKSDEFYIENSDYIIRNNGDKGIFISEFENIINDMVNKKGE